jgi:hypothetical protein
VPLLVAGAVPVDTAPRTCSSQRYELAMAEPHPSRSRGRHAERLAEFSVSLRQSVGVTETLE